MGSEAAGIIRYLICTTVWGLTMIFRACVTTKPNTHSHSSLQSSTFVYCIAPDSRTGSWFGLKSKQASGGPGLKPPWNGTTMFRREVQGTANAGIRPDEKGCSRSITQI